ncbi:hypothetical protein B9J78_05920 [bacterium Unc6]|nr:hypothetical protein [bacterium Unc6]
MAILEKDKFLRFPDILLIQASAGSGKTHTLVLRYLQYILSDNIAHNDISSILAITFTNNAALEMKQKILKKLKNIAISDKKDPEILEIVQIKEDLSKKASDTVENILNRYSDFRIQTIDSFMNRVLNCCTFDIGLPPSVEITTSYFELIDYTLSLILKEVVGSEESQIKKDFEDFLSVINLIEKNTFVWDPVFKITKIFNTLLEEEAKNLGEITVERQNPKPDNAFDRFVKKFELVENLINNPSLIKSSHNPEDYKKIIEEKNLQALMSKTFSERTMPVKKTTSPIYEQAKVKWESINEDLKEIAEYLSIARYQPYLRLYKNFKERLLKIKLERGWIYISDINKMLSDYIKKDTVPMVYFGLGDYLYHFMIDEFQDTDIIQWKNITPLIEEGLSRGGSLFAVGDLKQAIYMFRNADYRIMSEFINTINNNSQHYKYLTNISNKCRVKDLEKNFRSGSVIVQYVENLFKNKLKQYIEDDRTNLTTYTQYPLEEKKNKGYVLTKIIKEEKEISTEKDVLYGLIEDIKKRHSYRNIAILSNTNTDVETILEWLQNKQIPSCSYSSLDIRKRKIIMEITSLLKFLDKPTDDLSFATFILGDIFVKKTKTVGDDVLKFLFDSKDKKKSEYLYVLFRESNLFKDVWNKYFDVLFKNVGFLPPYDLIWLIFYKFEVLEIFEDQTGFLMKYLEAINTIEGKGKNSINELLKIIEGRQSQEEAILDITLPDYIDAIRVMTFHKSKGLDFPVVINLIYSKQRQRDAIYFKKTENAISVHYINNSFAKKSPVLESIYKEKQTEDRIQFLNTLYVATTRAKDELYNIVIKSTKADAFLSIFDEYENGQRA